MHLNRILLLMASITLFLGIDGFAQHSLELKKSVVFQQEPIDYYLQVDSAYFNTPHYVLWVDPVEHTIIDFNIHLPFAPVSKGSFYIEEDWKAFGEFILIALPKNNQSNIAFAHVDIVPNKAELLEEWRNLSATNHESWKKVNLAETGITFQFGPSLLQAPIVESAMLSAKLIDNNWELTVDRPEEVQTFTLQFSQKDSILFEANGNSEQQKIMVPVRRLPPGDISILLLAEQVELDRMPIQNPLYTLSEAEINFRQLNDSVAQFELTQLINPWMKIEDLSLKVSVTDFPELLINESTTGEFSFPFDEFEENTIAVFHSHQKNKTARNQKLVVFNKEIELYFTSDQDGNYFFDQHDYAVLDDDYHIVSHDNIQGKIDVDVTFPDIEIIRNQLPKLLAQIPARLSIQRNEKLFNFSLETTGVLLDEVSITAKRKRATLNDTREKPNSIHFRNTEYLCMQLVLNCTIHEPFWGYKPSRDKKKIRTIDKPLHLYAFTDNPKPNEMMLKYSMSHDRNTSFVKYPNTFFQSIAAKAKIRNIQEHYFKEEAIFGFFSEMISQAYAPLSLLYTSEIELPKVYSNAYFIVELIHQPTGMRQRVVKQIQ